MPIRLNGPMKTPFRDHILPIVFASPTDLLRLDSPRPRWDAMALTWEQRLTRQLLFVNCETMQVEWQAFLDSEQPWIRADDGLLHTPNLRAVDSPILPVGISMLAWELCTTLVTLPRIHLCVEALSADIDEFHDNVDPETMLLEDSYAVDLICGGVKSNRTDPDHCRELGGGEHASGHEGRERQFAFAGSDRLACIGVRA